MSDLTDRFERLATRGSVRGGDAVLNAARRAVDGGAVVRSVDEPAVVPIRDGFAVEPIDLQPSVARRRHRFGAIVASGGVAASLFVGALAIGSVVGSGSGSDSPAGAVRQLADAVSHEDPIAAAAVLAPEEVRSLSSTVSAAERRAQTLQLARSADAPLAGVDLSVDGLDLSTQALGADYAKVTIAGGHFSAVSHTGELAPLIQQALRRGHDGSTEANLATLEQSNDLPTFVMTVQQNGHWYVSAAYTYLEYVRELNDLPAADLGSGLRAAASLGAASPGDAVTGALQALSKGDWPSLISLAAPDEVPFYDYRAALEQLAGQSDYTGFTIDRSVPTATIDGDTAKVKLVASGRNRNGDTWSLDGGCFAPPSYSGELGIDGRGASLCDADVFSIIPLTVNEPGNGADARFTAVREDGRWFVSGVGTVLDLLDHAIANVSQRTVYSLMGVPNRLPPDGALTLGQPVTLPRGTYGYRVFTFAAHAGEEVVGQAVATDPQAENNGYYADVRVFGPDGHELTDAGGLIGGNGGALTLPSGGTYTFAVQSFVDARFTLYDYATAPEAAKHPPATVASQPCPTTVTTNPGEHCAMGSSKSSSATSSTVPSSSPSVASVPPSVP
jgi:hypothetical protein